MRSKKPGKVYVAFTLLLISLAVVFSLLYLKDKPSLSPLEFEIGNISNNFQKSYGPSDKLIGGVNLSLSEVPSNTEIRSSFGDSINLKTLLDLNNADYTCTPKNCGKDYIGTNPQNTKIFSLNTGESKIVGIRFNGVLDGINSVSLNISSSASQSCSNQFELDILNDGVIDIVNEKSSPALCDGLKSYGCFDSGSTTSELILGTTPYCQKIKLSESPAFKIGAWIKKESGSDQLKASLYNSFGEKVKECNLPEATTGEISCDVDYAVKKSEDYYVCISSSGTGSYKIRENTNPSTKCGFFGLPIKPDVSSYQIFAVPKRFDSVGKIQVNDFFNENGFSGMTINYIYQMYGSNLDCTNGCIVPIKIKSNTNQEITLSDLSAKYTTDRGIVESKEFYDLTESEPKISSKFEIINFDKANFTVPSEFGNHTFILLLGNSELFVEEITVDRVPTISSLFPLNTVAALPTEFTVFASSEANITYYKWEFGDGKNLTTSENRATHTYNETSLFTMKIEVTDDKNKSSSKIFGVVVGNPKEVANETLAKKLSDLSNISNKINSYTQFEKNSLQKILNLESRNEEIKNLQREFANAIDEDDYIEIMQKLVALKIPSDIVITKSIPTSPFFSNEDTISLSALSEIAGGEYTGSQQEYIKGIFAWNQENTVSTISYKQFTAVYQYDNEPILNTFSLKINSNTDLNYDYYLILKNLETLEFSSPDSREKVGHSYLKLSRNNDISFSTTEDVSFENLPAFISPSINRLSVNLETRPICNLNGACDKSDGENWRNCEDCSPSGIIVLIIALLLLIFLVLYLILQEWYKRKYETHLFRDRNLLFNLVSYINNSKTKGKDLGEIRNSLKKSGWNSEQITYAIRKYEGKRTGMWEIPIGGILNSLNKKKTKNPSVTSPASNPYSTKGISDYRKFNKGF